MENRRSSFFKKYTNVGLQSEKKKAHVVRRIFSEEEDDHEIESDTYVCNLRHPRDEEYDILKTNTAALEDLDTHFGPSYYPVHQSEMYTGKDIQASDISIDQTENHAQAGPSLDQDIPPLQASISQIAYHIPAVISTNQVLQQSDTSNFQTEDHAQAGTSLDQDILPLQASISQIAYHIPAGILTSQVLQQSDTSNFQTEDHAQAGTSLDQNILPLQASISQIAYHIPAGISTSQVLQQTDISIFQTEDHAQAGTSLDQDMLPLQASISQIAYHTPTDISTSQDVQKTYTISITQTENHAQTVPDQDILPVQASISQKDYTIHTDTSLGQGIHSLQATISQSEDYIQPGQSNQLLTSIAHKDYDQVGSSLINKTPEIPPMLQPYKKRKLDAKWLQEIEVCMQELNQETATREIETTISIDIEPEENTTLEQKKVKRKRNSVYKHIDFLSDGEDFVCSSSSWEASTDSDDTDSTSNVTRDRKKRTTKIQKKDKKRNETVLDDNKENTKPEKKERKINQKKARSNLMNSGKEYISKTGRVIEEKKVKSSTCTPENCRNNCYEISSEKRQAIFEHYWSLCKERRKDWLISNIKVEKLRIQQDWMDNGSSSFGWHKRVEKFRVRQHANP